MCSIVLILYSKSKVCVVTQTNSEKVGRINAVSRAKVLKSLITDALIRMYDASLIHATLAITKDLSLSQKTKYYHIFAR